MAASPAPSRALEALGSSVGAALASLDVEQRALLTRRDVDGIGYADLEPGPGAEVGAGLAAARLALYEQMRRNPAPRPDGPDCERARPLLAARQDGELSATADAGWLRAHVADCESCTSTRLAMREATLALRGARVGKAATVAFAAPAIAIAAPVEPPRPAAVAAPVEPPRAAPVAAPIELPGPSRWRGPATTFIVASALIGGGIAIAASSGSDTPRAVDQQPNVPLNAPPAEDPDAAAAERRAKRAAAAERRRKRLAAERRRKRAAATVTPAATQTGGTAEGDGASGAERQTSGQRKTTAPADGKAETETAGDGEAGLGAPAPGSPGAGAPNTITDTCSEVSPDCESG